MPVPYHGSASLANDPVLRWLVHLAATLCATPYALVLQRTAAGERVRTVWGWDQAPLELGEPLIEEVYRARDPVVVPDLASRTGPHPLVNGRPAARYAAGIALDAGDGDEPLALLVLDRVEGRNDSARHSQVLGALAAILGPLRQAALQGHQPQPEEHLLQRIIDAIPAPLFFKDAEFRYRGCNEAFARNILGRPAREVIGKGVYDLAPPELARIYEQADRELMDRGGAQQYESQVRFADGERRDIDFHKAVFTDPAGHAAGIVGVMLDITARKRAEEALRESEARFQAAFNNLPFDFWVCDTRGRYVAQNAASIDHWGNQIGRSPEDMDLPRETLALWQDNNARALAGEIVQGEVRLERGGETRYCYNILAPVRDDDGVILGLVGTNIDLTERRAAEVALARSEHRFRRFVDHAVDAFFLHDLQGRILDVNATACRQLGYSHAELTAMNVADIDVDIPAEQMRADWGELLSRGDGEPWVRESRHRTRGGEEFPVELRLAAFAEGGEPRFMVLATDITERKRSEAQLRERERMFQSVFHASEDAILILDGDTFVDCNEATVRMLRCQSKDEILPGPPWAISPERQPDGRLSDEKAEEMIRVAYQRHFHRFEWIHRRADGEDFPVEVTLTTVDLGGRQVLYVVWNDISERKARERQIQELAYFDALTLLPNRRLLQDRARQVLAMAERHRSPVGVMYMDLNRFKDINDTQGHDVGDDLLVKVAHRLQHCLRETDTLARLGGDEFALLLPETDEARMAEVADRVLAVFDAPFEAGELVVRLGASIGMVSYPADGDSLYELLKNADIAMYEAKATGSGYCAFHHHHAERLNERVALERSLRQALDRESLAVHYQPRVAAATGAVESVEALVRWRRDDGGWESPGVFIPVAERSGLIHALGRSVLREACQQCRRWRDAGLQLRVAVNVSAMELQREDFVESTLAMLRGCGLPGDALELEVTETAAMSDAEANIATLTALKAAGVHLAIDDFGTGYSSLSHLKRLPVDHLKVDYSFIRDMIDDPTDAGIVETIVALARSMGILTVAEGVETPEQFDAARRLGCDAVQGFLFARPQPSEALAELLHAGRVDVPDGIG